MTVSRDEFATLAARVDQIDMSGTRGAVVPLAHLSTQVAEVIKDLGAVEQSLADHRQAHQAEDARRRSNLRWIIGLVMGVLTSNGGIMTLLVTRR